YTLRRLTSPRHLIAHHLPSPPSPTHLTATPPPPPSPLSLHDALPIWAGGQAFRVRLRPPRSSLSVSSTSTVGGMIRTSSIKASRSEEHTSELQSRFDLVCRLLLAKKKQEQNSVYNKITREQSE